MIDFRQMLFPRRLRSLFFGFLSIAPVLFAADAPSGQTVYQQRCAACHDQGGRAIPPRSALQQIYAARILRARFRSDDENIAYVMPRSEREAVAKFLGKPGPEPGPSPEAFCKDRRVTVADSSKFAWNGWSPKLDNARFQPTEVAGLSSSR